MQVGSNMPGEEYNSAVGGGLKLKGSKPSGISKKKKKSKIAKTDGTNGSRETETSDRAKKKDAIREDIGEDELARLEDEAYAQDNGKTEAERKHEEMKRKRVRYSSTLFICIWLMNV